MTTRPRAGGGDSRGWLFSLKHDVNIVLVRFYFLVALVEMSVRGPTDAKQLSGLSDYSYLRASEISRERAADNALFNRVILNDDEFDDELQCYLLGNVRY